MSSFGDALAAGEFVITVELDPPAGPDLAPLIDLASELNGQVDAFVISDNRLASARLSPVLAGQRLSQEAGAEVIVTLTCRDRNRLALTSEMLAAAAAGLDNLLLVSGDFVNLGDQPGAKPVYDLDSVQALVLAGGLNGAARFLLGSGLAPEASPQPPQVMKFNKKLRAGAGFFMTKPLSGLAGLEAFVEAAGPLEAKLIAGVEVTDEAGPEAAATLAKEVKASGLAGGAHLSWPGAPQRLPELLALLQA